MLNPGLRFFHASTELVGITDVATGGAVTIDALSRQKLLAFCGIANPAAFIQDAWRWGFQVVHEDAFPDHHVYTEQDIRRLVTAARQHGAGALLTTEKDAVKLSVTGSPEMPIFACAIAFRILEEEEFERMLLTHLPHVAKQRNA